MRVQLEILPPCVQHAEKTDLGSEMFGIGGNLKQRRRTAMKQEIVDNLLVVEGQPAQLMGNGEDHMDIFDWQKLLPGVHQAIVRERLPGISDNASNGTN